MKFTRLDGAATALFFGACVGGYFLWKSEGARLWISDVARFCGFI